MRERVSESEFAHRDVTYLDIAYDKVPEKQYKESEVPYNLLFILMSFRKKLLL